MRFKGVLSSLRSSAQKKGSEPAKLKTGDRIGRYRIIQELGRGGMGAVYEVCVEDGQFAFALKAFALDHGNKEFLRKRFLAEAKILSRLSNPRLVHVHDLGVDAATGTPYYVMDIVRTGSGTSETLEDIRKKGSVTETSALRWFSDIREGLEYIHSQGVIHRDIKLENVLVDAEGHAVLSDFGVSRIFNDRLRNELSVTTTFIAGETTGTQPVMGTYWYLAPEIRKGGAATPESDWYALGVLMYRLLTGMWYEPNTKAFDLLAPFSRDCQQIVRQLLSDDPARRKPVPIDVRKSAPSVSLRTVCFAFLTVLALGLLAWYCLSPTPTTTPTTTTTTPTTTTTTTTTPLPPTTPTTTTPPPQILHFSEGVDFAFCPCPAGTNVLDKVSLVVTRPYWLAETPVTWRQWRTVRGEAYEGGWKGRDKAPATYLTCEETSNFCARLTQRFAKELPEGYEIRLPTIAEWRLAFQTGETDPQRKAGDTAEMHRRKRSWIGWFGQGLNGQWQTCNMRRYFKDRKKPEPLVSQIWPDFPSQRLDGKDAKFMRSSSKFAPLPVRQKPPNKLGLYDMYGNCFEMCADRVNPYQPCRFRSEFGLRFISFYSGKSRMLFDPITQSGKCPAMLGSYLAPGLPGDDVWIAPFERLPHLGFRPCIGPKIPK